MGQKLAGIKNLAAADRDHRVNNHRINGLGVRLGVDVGLAPDDLLNQVAQIGFTAIELELCGQGVKTLAYQIGLQLLAKRSCGGASPKD